MTKIEKQMIIGVVVVAIGTVFALNGMINSSIKGYKLYKTTTDAYKQKCLAKFKTIEYEVVSDILYCKSVNGLVKFNKG